MAETNFVKTEDIRRKMQGQVLGGAKVPHSISFPVLRRVSGDLKIAFFLQFYSAEDIKKERIRRPSYWYTLNLSDGENMKEIPCHMLDFCTAPQNYVCPKGEAARKGTLEDVSRLCLMLDEIRRRYMNTGVLDAMAYREYQQELFAILPAGQLNFYRELTKLI